MIPYIECKVDFNVPVNDYSHNRIGSQQILHVTAGFEPMTMPSDLWQTYTSFKLDSTFLFAVTVISRQAVGCLRLYG